MECRLHDQVWDRETWDRVTDDRWGAWSSISSEGDTIMSAESRTWQELCEAASKEPDSEQLMTLISELIKALDNRKLPATPAA